MLPEVTMSVETEKFVFSNIRIKYAESNEIRADRQRAAPSAVGITSTDVLCKSCDHVWSAREYGEGRFHQGIGVIMFDCPECKAEEKVHPAKLMKP
jgi:hypothetical protein